MYPGIELDALIAEKVMGMQLMKFGPGNPKYDPVLVGFKPVPQFSTDIAEAWKVLEKLSDVKLAQWKGGWICTNVQSDCWSYYVNSNQYEDLDKDQYMERAPTAPHAICLAALRDIQKKQEGG